MNKIKKPFDLETAFNTYVVDELLGEGGAGRVFGGVDGGGQAVAIKILTNQTRDKRQRFKNEIGFLSQNRHPNVVTVVDHGVSGIAPHAGPFYVMNRFSGSLRDKVGSLSPDAVMPLFSQILDGVEAAHLQGVTHRDLKPENILLDAKGRAAVADFGVASFTVDLLRTAVDTAPTQRLANFQYAAPEQRIPGGIVGQAADIYALGLMLNELFTGSVPHGTDYRSIASVSQGDAYLDQIVTRMIRQNPSERLSSIAAVKTEIQKYHAEAVSLQKLRELDRVVIPEGEVSDPLAHRAPKLIDAEWNNGTLKLTMDQAVNEDWIQSLYNMGSYTSVMGAPPQAFRFEGAKAYISVQEHSAQDAINYFKDWLPKATARLKYVLEEKARRDHAERIKRLQLERQAEERRLAVNRSLRI